MVMASLVAEPSSMVCGRVVEVPGLQSTGLSGYGAWAEVFCACGIFLDPGRIPCLLHWQVDSLPLNHHRSPLLYIFAYMFIALED